ncbi:MAG: hypothetical protein GY828_04885 [Candidatus Gracilibacteria bacterium]|nr:hypothetical protein [Candidatus Gracilibacteria bacterium]
MSFEPNKITFSDVGIQSLGSLIAGLVGSIIIIILTFALGDIVDFAGNFSQASSGLGLKTNAFFPLVFSVVTFIGTSIMVYFTYFIAHKINSQRYRNNIIILGQIAFFNILTYLIITPVYIYAGVQSYDNLMYIFLAHCFIITFGTNIILEVLNNYRHILIGLYGSFLGLFFSIITTLLIFSSFSSGFAKMISLLLLLPFINFLTTFLKQFFEMVYYHYSVYMNRDGLGDIFYQIEMEEKELLREEEEKNTI